ncbi:MULTISPECIES: glycosyltransferase family 4 protein [unclassified Pseudoalteromonas]|uniref:glycosyltransferase family 4 protein n=1 Tax=unclassified Pseudoalteromonas TaxID=194690 RepID=UPI00041239D9|nr:MULTISPECIES: glycosyltransferase family 4 protein [unclassified Pseudoalteromonas]
MKILLINNIPTPYRTYLFDKMTELLDINSSIEIFYQFEKEVERHWELDRSKFKHNHTFSSKVLFGNNKYYGFKAINIDLLRYDFSHYDFVIFSPLMSVGNMLLSQIIPGHKQIHWIESNFDSLTHDSYIAKLVKKLCLRKPENFLVPGSKSVDYISSFNSNYNNNYINFPNLIDFHKFSSLRKTNKSELRTRNKLSSSTRVFTIIGEVCFRKGSDNIIPLIKRLSGDFHFFILGTGDLLNKINSEVEDSHLQSKISVIGQVNQEKVIEYLSMSDFFLHLARKDPSPLVCIEACTTGLPMVISEQTGNVREVVTDNGFTFNANDLDSIFDVVVRCINMDGKELDKLRENSISLSDKNFDPNKVINNLYEQLKFIKGVI